MKCENPFSQTTQKPKLIIQIPCFNEEDQLADTLKCLPKQLEGVGAIETLLIDDGSSDQSVEVARKWGVDHVLSLPSHRGLAIAFKAGIRKSLHLGADIVVNTDADNQYEAKDIALLLKPILEKRALVVIGARSIRYRNDFSWLKKWVHWVGNIFLSLVFFRKIPDACSGFRAMSRLAAEQFEVRSNYTWTHEVLFQTILKAIPCCFVSIRSRSVTRPSRLIKSIPQYLFCSFSNLVHVGVLALLEKLSERQQRKNPMKLASRVREVDHR